MSILIFPHLKVFLLKQNVKHYLFMTRKIHRNLAETLSFKISLSIQIQVTDGVKCILYIFKSLLKLL